MFDLSLTDSPISRVYLADCMDFMKEVPDKFFELAIVDPPYGMNALDGSFTRKKYNINRSENWDCYRPDEKYFNELFRISVNQVIWGGNYFISDLYDSKCFIIWDKRRAEGLNNYAMCEFAWASFDKIPAKIFRKTSNQDNRLHPMQKPVELYKFILKYYAKPGDKIFDSHMGSQSSRIACWDGGFDFWGTELDPDYFRDGCKRFDNHKKQLNLFINNPLTSAD